MGETLASRFENNSVLLAEIAESSKEAETFLVERYAKSLRFILSRRTDDQQLVSDIVQDTFVVVIAKARKAEIHKPEALAAFIRQTGINLLLAYFRKETRRATESAGEAVVDIPDTRSDVYAALESKQSVEVVQQVLDEMKVPRDRDILISYFVKEEAKADICSRLELTPAHFDRVLFRARSRLKELIQVKLGGTSVFN